MVFAGVLISATVLLTSAVISKDLEANFHTDCPCSINNNKDSTDCSSRNLTKIPECVPRTTQHLNLANNKLQYQTNQFQDFENLTYLDLSGNRRFEPENDSFAGLAQLTILYLNNTYFQGTKSSVFNGLYHLEKLYLNRNHIVNLSKGLFDDLSSLVYLDLSDDSDFEINDCQFAGLQSLLFLDMNYNAIIPDGKPMGKYLFSGLSSLKRLSLFGTQWFYNDTPPELFQPLVSLEELHIEWFCRVGFYNCSHIDEYLSQVPSLKTLYIQNNMLEYTIGPGFSLLRNLEEIYFLTSDRMAINPCRLEYLRYEKFQHLKDSPLSKIAIYDCYIYFLDAIAANNLNNLTTVDLKLSSQWCQSLLSYFSVGLNNTKINHIRFSAQCQFTTLVPPGRVFHGLQDTSLQVLDLSDGFIEVVTSDFTANLPKSLEHLYFNNNKITCVDPKSFHALQNLLTLDFSNQKKDINIGQGNSLMIQNLHKDCTPLPNSLISLSISNSGLMCMMAESFCGPNISLKSLKAAYLRNFNCRQAFWKSLKKLNSLEVLDLSGNFLRVIPIDGFTTQGMLKHLLLVGNYILEVSFDVANMMSLNTLDLRNNTILYANQTFTKTIQDLAKVSSVKIYLDNNPLVCDCKRTEFVAWLRDTSVIHQKNVLFCKYTNGTKLSLSLASEIHGLLEYGCIGVEVTLGCVALFTFLHLILIIIALYWHNRSKFNYLLYMGRCTINPYHPLEDNHIEMDYDVYISYERDYNVTPDETLHEFVAQKLYPGLRQKGFRVLIREELDIGMRLYEVISQAIRKSDKVLVLLSKSYCSDYWNVFEFNMAALEGIYTKRQVVIPIAFENVDRADLHDEVHAFLKVLPVPAYTRNSRITEQDFIDYVSKLIRDNRPFD